MALPKLSLPMHEVTMPSTKKKIKFRPMIVKDEKILLMAKMGNDENEILRAIKQVVNNCLVDDIDIDTLAIFDLEYLFMKIRAVSISNVAKVTYLDNGDNIPRDFEIDLDTVEVVFPEGIENTIKLDESSGIMMHYPSAALYSDENFLKLTDAGDVINALIVHCVDKVYVDDKMYNASDYNDEELNAFLDNLPTKAYEQMRVFLSNSPRLYHKIEYKNSEGKDRSIELTTLSDFFTLY